MCMWFCSYDSAIHSIVSEVPLKKKCLRKKISFPQTAMQKERKEILNKQPQQYVPIKEQKKKKRKIRLLHDIETPLLLCQFHHFDRRNLNKVKILCYFNISCIKFYR